MKLVIQKLTKTYQRGGTVALDKVDAGFTPGIYGILGANGAGKSTLMNLITDQLRPDSGEIFYDGRSIVELGAAYRDILGYMPQQQGIYEDFTGRRFLWYIAALKGLSTRETRQRVDELLDIVNLSEAADRRLGTYSGGMKQRILIAQALLNDPEILVLDEPTAGVDPNERIRLRNFISTIAKDKIVLLATHVVSDIEYIAKEIVLLKKGKVLRKASPVDITKELAGKVYEAVIEHEQLSLLEETYKVSNINTTSEGLNVRFITDQSPDLVDSTLTEVTPNLEDVYLYHFG